MTGHAALEWMGQDKVRYLVYCYGRWRWQPGKALRAAGFRNINLGPGVVVDGKNVPSPQDMARAIQLNDDWERHRRGLPAQAVERNTYPPGSIGEAYLRAMRLREAERQARGVTWTTEQHSRDDWPRAWRWVEPLFGHCDPATVTPEQLIEAPDGLRPIVAARVSESEAHRVIKVWRALWARMAALRCEATGRTYCDAGADPSFQFANPAPAPRAAVWREGEAVRLVKQAWRSGYKGLAALLAVSWDSQLSPVDARKLKAEQRRRDPLGSWFAVDRAKTGRPALATLSPRTETALDAYLASLGAELVGPIFRNRSGRPYSKDTLGDDFRVVRAATFGEGERRHLADFRRSGTVEAFAGKAQPEEVSAKMANTLSQSNRLHQTYSPVRLAAVRDADTARRRGRTKLR